MSHTLPEPQKIPYLKAAIVCFLISAFGFTLNKFFLQEKNQRTNDEVVQVRVLKFEDRLDKGVTVIDAQTNQVVDVVQGEAGFVRGILRTIARERRIRGLNGEDPVYLKAFNNGRLILVDPQTNTSLELESFGSTNVESFKSFLKNNNNS
jgi:putative photosynthetic complex assembly protein